MAAEIRGKEMSNGGSLIVMTGQLSQLCEEIFTFVLSLISISSLPTKIQSDSEVFGFKAVRLFITARLTNTEPRERKV